MKSKTLDIYHISDARQLLSVLPRAPLVDTTITSPPYWNLKDYGSKNQIGFGQSYEDYLDDLGKIFSAVRRVTKSTGSLWIVADTIKHNGELKLFPFDLANRLKDVGWNLHDIIVWHKDKTLPWSHRGKLRNIFEYILFFSRGKNFKYHLSRVRETEGLKEWWVHYPERYSPQGKAPTRTWSIPIPRQGSWGENWVRHFCPFPPELVRRIILLTTQKGDVVLDPFAGSGVVLAQAKALERRFVGLDLRKPYRKMFETKVRPSIIALEKKNQQSEHADNKRRDKFSAVIWKLRKTKYPRELLRLYEKEHRKSGVVGLIALSRQKHSLEVVFIFARGERPPKRFVSRIERLTCHAPLSKYGLQVTVKTQILEDDFGIPARNGFHYREALSLYENGKTHRVSSQVTIQKFLESLRNGLGKKEKAVPPILSNIRVKVSPGARIPARSVS